MPLAENCLEERAKASAYHIQTLLWLFYLSTRHCVNLWTGDPRVPGSMALGACGCEHRQQLHSVGAAREEWGAKGSGVREGNPPEGEVCVCGGVGVKEHLRAEWRWRKRWSQASTPPVPLLLRVHPQDAHTHVCSGRGFLHRAAQRLCACVHVCAWQGAPWRLSPLALCPLPPGAPCLCRSVPPLPRGPLCGAPLPYCVPLPPGRPPRVTDELIRPSGPQLWVTHTR